MEWDLIRDKLEQVLQAPVTRGTVPIQEWRALSAGQYGTGMETGSVSKDQVLHFRLGQTGTDSLDVLKVEEVLITPSERRLVEFIIQMGLTETQEPPTQLPIGSEEKKAQAIRDWLLRHLESGETAVEMPELLASQFSLYEPRIPFLLYGDYSVTQKVTYSDLKKLLETFFDEEIVLIPLMEKEWLILSPESVLSAARGDERDEEEDETLEEALTSICSGFYEMLANEWVGECHVTIQYPMTPAKSLLPIVRQMRETIMLGKRYHLGSNLHLPWDMYMEKLLYSVPEADKNRFIGHILKSIDHALDAEMLSTLEQFFAQDCNVSETAKKLYIHRNTLLYRLDKFKQETGRDVRSFNDAFLVKAALLLYKITKRK